MTSFKKHTGKLIPTDTKCVVLYMQIPGRADHALIVESDSLPDRYHQAVMDAIESNEGQEAKNLADVLGRRPFPDGGGIDIMNALHTAGLLRPISIDLVAMSPAPGVAYPLREILEAMGTIDSQDQENVPITDENDPTKTRFNPHSHNVESSNQEAVEGAARGLIVQAELLEKDAARLREQAYAMAPTLKPKATKAATKAKPAKTTAKSSPKKTGRGRKKAANG